MRALANARCFLSLGSNVGEREANVRAAIERLGRVGEVRKVSSFYETEPVEFTEQPWFVNCVVELKTELGAVELMRELLKVEREMGREREAVATKGPRVIDLDLLLFGDEVIDTEELTVPHPAMHLRRFVLEPLSEVAPEVVHPELRKSAREMLGELSGKDEVRKMQSARKLPKKL